MLWENKPDFEGLTSRVDTVSELVGDTSVSDQIASIVDSTLSVSGKAADAKAVSDAIVDAKEYTDALANNVAYIDSEDNENITDVEADSAATAVLYTAQTLTEEQKTQARTNINAASIAYVLELYEELKAMIEAGNTDGAIALLDTAILDSAILA